MQACTAPTTRRSMFDGFPQKFANNSMLAKRSTRSQSVCCWSLLSISIPSLARMTSSLADTEAAEPNTSPPSTTASIAKCVRNRRVMSTPNLPEESAAPEAAGKLLWQSGHFKHAAPSFSQCVLSDKDGSLGADLCGPRAPFARGRRVAACGASLALPSPTEGPMRTYLALISLGAAAVAGLSGSWSGGLAAPKAGPVLADRSPSAIAVDTELVLAVDVSYSMDPDEQALQREGYITGLTSREFMHALRGGMHGKVAVTYFEWAGPYDQKIVVPWRLIDGPEAADAFANEIARAPYRRASRTSISSALHLRQAAVRRLGLSRHPPRRRCLGRRRQQQRRARHAGARRPRRRPASRSTACRSCSSGRTRSRWISTTSTSTTRTA